MELSKYFERRTRDDGTHFYTLTDDRPDWLHEAVMEAHGEEGPNDWVYDTLDSIAKAIDDLDPDDLDDASHEIADSLTTTWNSERADWLSGHLSRAFWVDDARRDGLLSEDSDTFEQLGIGQYCQIRFMAEILLQAVADNLDEDTEEEA